MNIIRLDYMYKYEDIVEKSLLLAKTYNSCLSLDTIGVSHDNRRIFLMKFGKCNKNILITAGVHGREYINSAVLLRIIEKYCSLVISGNISLKDCGIIFVPVLNPDGYVIATEGFGGIKNKELRRQCEKSGEKAHLWKWNSRCVDINRNFDSLMYKTGVHTGKAGSENETKAFINLVNTNDTIGYIDFHSRGNTIYYYRHAMGKKYNIIQKNIALRLSKLTGYTLMYPPEEINDGDTGGNTVHYYSEQIGRPAITIETIEEESAFPLKYTYAIQVYYQTKYVPLEFLKLCMYNAECERHNNTRKQGSAICVKAPQ